MMGLLCIFICLITAKTFKVEVKAGELHMLLTQYQNSKYGMGRLDILLKIDSVHVFKLANENNIPDSAILLSNQARELSAKLHTAKGYEEATFLLAKAFADKKDIASAAKIMIETRDSLQVQISINISEYYVFKPGELKGNLDSSYPYIVQAKKLSESIGST